MTTSEWPDTPKNESITFNGFSIDNPDIPNNNDDFVMLADEESSLVNICNLTRPELKEIFSFLDPVVQEVLSTASTKTAKFRGATRNINFQISHANEDGTADIVAINGRDVQDEDDPGDYCHDFEIEGINLEDWEKLKNLF